MRFLIYILLIFIPLINLGFQDLNWRFILVVPFLVILISLNSKKKAYFLALVSGFLFDMFLVEPFGFYLAIFLGLTFFVIFYFKLKLVPYFWVNLGLGLIFSFVLYFVLIYIGQWGLYGLEFIKIKPIPFKIWVLRSIKNLLISGLIFAFILSPAYFYLRFKRFELYP